MSLKFLNPIYFVLLLSLYTLSSTSMLIAEAETNQASKQQEIAQKDRDDLEEEEIDEEEEETPELKGIPKNVQKIAKKITVRINSPKGNGSGIIFGRDEDKDRYYVVTAKHVVEKEQTYEIITKDGKVHKLEAESIERFADSDLAILYFESGKDYETGNFSNYDLGINKDFWVFVYGWAKTDAEPETLFSIGKVVGKETGIFLVKDDLSLTKTNGYELVYTNISERGMSGGPVLDTNGRVIGIHTSAEGERYRLKNKLQLGFSLGIPIATFLESDVLKSVVTTRSLKLQTTKEKPDLVPFSIPTLTKEDLDSVPTSLLKQPTPGSGESSWVNYGNELWRSSNYPEAVVAFDKAISNKTNFYQAYYGKGLALYDLGNYEAAAVAFKQATELQSDFYPAWYRQSLSLLNLKQYNQALSVTEKAISLKPENTALYVLRGEALQNLAQYEAAIAAYNKAIAIDNNPLVLTRRSSIYRILGRQDLAFADLKQAIKSDPRYTEGYINQGLAHFQSGNYQIALINFNHVLLIDRQDPRAYIGRGFVKQELGETTQAKSDFNRAFKLYQQEQENRQLANNVNLQPNKYGQVATDFHYIFGLNAAEGNIYLGQGLASLLANDRAQAIESFTQAKQFFKTQGDNFSQRLTQQFLTQIQQKSQKTAKSN